MFAVGQNAHSQEWLCYSNLLCAVKLEFTVVGYIGNAIAALATLRVGSSIPQL
jgi:hypothetical protein